MRRGCRRGVAAMRSPRCFYAPKNKPPPYSGGGLWDKDPGDDLLSHGLGHTTIGAGAFHFRVRNGIGWFHTAMVTRERVEGRRLGATLSRGTGRACARSGKGVGRSEVFGMLLTYRKLRVFVGPCPVEAT